MIILIMSILFITWVSYEGYREYEIHREERLSALIYDRMKEIIRGEW